MAIFGHMFLPVLKASFIFSGIFKDGTTKPLLVKADDGKDYVVKLFSKKDASQRCYTAAETYANYLAQQFDLNVPPAVFIDIPPELIELYKDVDPTLYALLSTKDTGHPCFGTEYFGTFPVFSTALARKYIEPYDLACIFGFDMLILNEDRRH